MAQMALWGSQEKTVSPVQMGKPGRGEGLDNRDQRVHPVHQDLQEMMVVLETEDHPGHVDNQVKKYITDFSRVDKIIHYQFYN